MSALMITTTKTINQNNMAQQTLVGYTYLVNCFMSPNLKHELKLIDIKNKTYKKRGKYRKMYTLNYKKPRHK
jgi:hypothetical protein